MFLVRLRESGELKHNHLAHGTALGALGSSTKVHEIDYFLPKLNLHMTLRISVFIDGSDKKLEPVLGYCLVTWIFL